MASYYEYKETALRFEGGYQNKRSDKGNRNSKGQYVGTNFGISARLMEDLLKRPPTVLDMKSITPSKASEIYKKLFWNKIRASEIKSQAVAEMLVDHGINAGTGTAVRIMQNLLNTKFGKNLVVDGISGRNTIAAINSVNPYILVNDYGLARIKHYESIGNNSWINIWKKRVKDLAKKFGVELKKKILLK